MFYIEVNAKCNVKSTFKLLTVVSKNECCEAVRCDPVPKNLFPRCVSDVFEKGIAGASFEYGFIIFMTYNIPFKVFAKGSRMSTETKLIRFKEK